MFFDGDQPLGQRTFALTRQRQSADPAFAKDRENVRWDLGGVTFLTLHVTVDASDPNVFTFRPRIVTANLTPRQ